MGSSCKILGRPPILSYGSYCLDNWYRPNPKEDISLENVALITNFLGGVDEDWFVTIHVCIENAARMQLMLQKTFILKRY